MPAHYLLNGGNPYASDTCSACMVEATRHGVYRDESGDLRPMLSDSGHAKCTCGQLGTHVLNNSARRDWFSGHKRAPRG